MIGTDLRFGPEDLTKSLPTTPPRDVPEKLFNLVRRSLRLEEPLLELVSGNHRADATMDEKFLEAKVKLIDGKGSLQGAAGILISADAFRSLVGPLELGKLTSRGRLCLIERVPKDEFTAPLRRQASLCLVPESMKRSLAPKTAAMTRGFKAASGFEEGEQVRITLVGQSTPDAQSVEVRHDPAKDRSEDTLSPGEVHHWEWVIRKRLDRAGDVFPGMEFKCNPSGFEEKTFKVVSVNSRQDNFAQFDSKTSKVQINQLGENLQLPIHPKKRGSLVVTALPGLGDEIKQLNKFLRAFSRRQNTASPNEQISCGIIIHGSRGTGKSLILKQIAATGWGEVHRIEPSAKSSDVSRVFKEAIAQQPSIILIDRLEVLINKDRPNYNNVIEALGREMDDLSPLEKGVDILPNVVVIATCLDYMNDIPKELQTPTRFRRQIPLRIPDVKGRLEILRHINPRIELEDKEDFLAHLAERTHAYNGSDLRVLNETAWDFAWERVEDGADLSHPAEPPSLTGEDFEHALKHTKPSAMHDVNLKPPTVRWNDIAGSNHVKNELMRMMEYHKSSNPRLAKLFKVPPKGILMCGPPGCSKTLCAQALATESSLNFFAVKGPELLNMYVGESERAIRNLFARARAASPSVIFFDEIDCLGGTRPGGPGGGGSQASVNVIAALLTEMDGFEALSGVYLLAATNRPDAIDPALIRRFDKTVYVGLPNDAEREAIFRLNLKDAVTPDIDFGRLAELSRGYTGAEIKGICNQACMRVVDRFLFGREKEQADDACVEMEDVVAALRAAPKRVTDEQVREYQKWAERFQP